MSDTKTQQAIARASGRLTSSQSGMGYTAEFERSLAQMPLMATFRGKLQNDDGSFAFGPDPLGTDALIPGRYYIDTWGKKVPY